MSIIPQYKKGYYSAQQKVSRKCAKTKSLGSEVRGDYSLPLFSTVSMLDFYDREENEPFKKGRLNAKSQLFCGS